MYFLRHFLRLLNCCISIYFLNLAFHQSAKVTSTLIAVEFRYKWVSFRGVVFSLSAGACSAEDHSLIFLHLGSQFTTVLFTLFREKDRIAPKSFVRSLSEQETTSCKNMEPNSIEISGRTTTGPPHT